MQAESQMLLGGEFRSDFEEPNVDSLTNCITLFSWVYCAGLFFSIGINYSAFS